MLTEWIRARYDAGAHIYSACSGAVMLAETGLLDGRDATSHWGYQDLFRREFPRVRFHPEPNLCFADPSGRIVTAGGTTSWHDLALHIIARHVSPGEAIRIAKVYLLKWHDEGQLPFEPLLRHQPHVDALVRDCEQWLKNHFREPGAVAGVVDHARVPERTLKRRFKAATGLAIIDYVQNLRIEEAKRLLESSDEAADEIRLIARDQRRWARIASAFPVSATTRNQRGVNKTDWIRIDRATYEACMDPRDYRPPRLP